MDRAEIRRRCRRLLAELDLPRPFDIGELCRRLGAARGRPIVLLPMQLDADAPCGLLLGGARADYIVYEQSTTPLHQEHIVLHEVGHLMFRHTMAELPENGTMQRLFPDLDPVVVRRMLGRTEYSTREEAEAETLATLILAQADRREAAELPVDPAIAEALRRIENSL